MNYNYFSSDRCLLSLSRSTKLLRTYLSDVEIHMSKHVLEVITCTNCVCSSIELMEVHMCSYYAEEF